MHPSEQQNNEQWPISAAFSYLQWTTMGPQKGGLTALTFLRNLSMPMGENGTPKSGQLVKWSWVTSRGALALSFACWTRSKKESHLAVNNKGNQPCMILHHFFKGTRKSPSWNSHIVYRICVWCSQRGQWSLLLPPSHSHRSSSPDLASTGNTCPGEGNDSHYSIK